MAYFNHAGTSWPKPIAVREAVDELWASSPDQWPGRFAKAHQAVADFFHVPNRERLLLTPGCTSALSVALADIPWQAGDVVVTSRFEHHALHRPLLKLSQQQVELKYVPPTDDELIDLEALETTLKQDKVRLVAMTAASNVTGQLAPIRKIVAVAKKHGALTLIDGAQVAGWWDLDVPSLGVDLFTFAGHKGPQAPWGIGGLYVAQELAMNTPGAVCSIGEVAPCAPMPGYCDVGSVDLAALVGLEAGLRWLSSTERKERLAVAQSQVARIWQTLDQLPGVRLLGNPSPLKRMPTLAFTVDSLSAGELGKRFSQRQITVSVGLQCAPIAHEALRTAPDGVVRISVGPTTTEEEIDRCVALLPELIG